MSVLPSNLNELIDLAFNSRDFGIHEILKGYADVNVRRALAKNRNISTDIANILAKDPVLNVSFVAIQNPNCTIRRDFSSNLPRCVVCPKNERDLDCHLCC